MTAPHRILQLRWGTKQADVESKLAETGQSRLAFANAHGFASWQRVTVFLRESSGAPTSPEQASPEQASHAFQRLACLRHANDSTENIASAKAILRDDPRLAEADLWSVACVGDVARVRAFLDDGSDPNATGGYFDWPPLLYACYSRLQASEGSLLDTAKLLLDRGADPNAHYWWGGAYRFTALTGAFGHGESGPRMQPEHRSMHELVEALLAAGADPNDGQALYNRMFADDESVCLKLLLAHGLGREHKTNWRIEAGDGTLVPHPQQTLQYQLTWAVDHRHTERARLLIEAGASLETPGPECAGHGQSYYRRAMLAGLPEIASLMTEHGASPCELSTVDETVAACMAGDRAGVRRLCDANPGIAADVQSAHAGLLHRAASLDLSESIRILVEELGYDVNVRTHNTPLHDAAWSGSAGAARTLLALGADLNARDARFDSTPANWAAHAGRDALAAELKAAAQQ